MSMDSKKLDLEEIQECLNFFDQRGDGRIDVSQAGTCLRALGLCPTEAQVAQLTQQFEEGSRLSVEQFVPIFHELEKEDTAKDRSAEDLMTLLANFDRHDNGNIESAVLEYVLTATGEPLTATECQLVLAGKETTDGMVPIAEFARFLTSF